MSHYHIIISQEKRVSTPEAPRELAQSLTTEAGTQLHTMGASYDGANDNVIYAAEWDGQAPNVTVLKGDISTINLMFAGWPSVTEAPE